MLYSILVGIATYYAILFVIGVLVNTMTIEGSLIAFAAICFIGGYLARSSRFVFRMANWLGGISAALVLASWVLLPILQASGSVWVTIIAVLCGMFCYIWSRRIVHRRWLCRNRSTGQMPAPPFGAEWCRWVVAFLL